MVGTPRSIAFMLKSYFSSQDKAFTLLKGDSLELLPLFEHKFDMVFADPPSFLSNDGLSIQNGEIVSVNKRAWVLDPFAGSSTTGIASSLLGCKFLGIDLDKVFFNISVCRRKEIENPQTADLYRSKMQYLQKVDFML